MRSPGDHDLKRNGPVPIGLGRDVGDLVLGQDAQLALAEDVLEAGIGDVEREAHGERIDRLDLLDHGDVGARPRAGGRIEDALHGGHHVVGVERRPLWNLTPSRSLKVHTLRSSEAVQLTARSGLVVRSRSMRVRPLKTRCTKMYSSPMVVLAGSRLLSVLPTATRSVPCASAGPARPAASATAISIRRMPFSSCKPA